MISLDTLPQDVLLDLWPYIVKNGDNRAMACTCHALNNADFNFITRNKKRIVTVLEKTDSLLCRSMRYLANREATERLDFYKFNTALRKFIMNSGCPCPSNRLLLTEDIQSCSKTLDRMKEDEALEKAWQQIPLTFYDFYPQNLEILGGYVLVLKASSIRDWLFLHQDLVQRVIALNLSSLKLSSLPEEIEQFVNLQTLYLNNNRLTKVPPEILRLKKLHILVLTGNPFLDCPPNIGNLVHRGNGAYTREHD